MISKRKMQQYPYQVIVESQVYPVIHTAASSSSNEHENTWKNRIKNFIPLALILTCIGSIIALFVIGYSEKKEIPIFLWIVFGSSIGLLVLFCFYKYYKSKKEKEERRNSGYKVYQ